MTTTSKPPDFVRAESVFTGGRNVRRYFAFYGSRKKRITKRQFDSFLAASKAGIQLDRKQGGKSKNGHATIPGAGHCWPMRVEALANHPSQNEAFRKAYKERGVNVELSRTGVPIVPDEGAYRRLRKVHGAYHRNSYNG